MTDVPKSPSPPPVSQSTTNLPLKLVLLLTLAIAATGVVLWLVWKPRKSSNEAVVSVVDRREADAAGLYLGEVIDASGRSDLKPELGRRYRVRVESESRDGASVVARVGRTPVFLKGARTGEVVEIEIIRLFKTTAEGTVINRPPSPDAVRESPAEEPFEAGEEQKRGGGYRFSPSEDKREEAAESVPSRSAMSRQIYTGVVKRVGKLGDGAVEVEGNTVYVPGAQKGEWIVFEVKEKGARFWSGRLIRKLGPDERPSRQKKPEPFIEKRPERTEEGEGAVRQKKAERAPSVQVGAEFEVEIVEQARRNPERDGVARIDGFPVIVPNSQPGDHVKIRIINRRPNSALAEVIERLPNGGP